MNSFVKVVGGIAQFNTLDHVHITLLMNYTLGFQQYIDMVNIQYVGSEMDAE